VSSFRPNTDICIFSDSRHILNTLNLVWGVRSFFYDRFTTTDETIFDVIDILKKEDIVEKGNIVINTGSMPLEARFRTNMLKVTVV
jgi:pyruvate kinase